MKKAIDAIREYFKNESATELLIKLICAFCISTMLIFIIMGCSQKANSVEKTDKNGHETTSNTYKNKDDMNPTTTSHITTGKQGIGNY